MLCGEQNNDPLQMSTSYPTEPVTTLDYTAKGIKAADGIKVANLLTLK